MIKGSIQAEDITTVNICAPNIGTPLYIREIVSDIKGEIESNTIIVGDFNTPLTPIDRSSKHKINKEKQVLNDTLDEMYPSNKMDLIDIFRTDDILGHRSNLSKFNKIEIVSNVFSNHTIMILDINYKKKNCKKHKHMEIKQHISK